MAEAMLAVDPEFPIVLTVHDEIVAEVPEHKVNMKRFKELMERAPAWAEGLPIEAEVKAWGAIPEMKLAPWRHQADAYQWLEGRDKAALWIFMRGGKSKIIIDDFNRLRAEGKINAALVIAPNGVHSNWGAEGDPRPPVGRYPVDDVGVEHQRQDLLAFFPGRVESKGVCLVLCSNARSPQGRSVHYRPAYYHQAARCRGVRRVARLRAAGCEADCPCARDRQALPDP